jgi:hypothetical protein
MILGVFLSTSRQMSRMYHAKQDSITSCSQAHRIMDACSVAIERGCRYRECTGRIGGWVTADQLERIQNQAVVVQSKFCLHSGLRNWRYSRKCCQNIRCPGLDTNRTSLECKLYHPPPSVGEDEKLYGTWNYTIRLEIWEYDRRDPSLWPRGTL